MCSDAFGCNRIHFGALGCVQTLPEKFGFFGKFGVLFGQFKLGGCTFPGVLRARGVLLSGCTSRSLHYMHWHKMCHRDLKLENWVYADDSEDSKLKLIDFGFSKIWPFIFCILEGDLDQADPCQFHVLRTYRRAAG